MTHPNWFADDAEMTGTVPAAPAVDPVELPTAKLRAVATAVQSTLLPEGDTPPLTAGPGPLPAELSNPAMEPVHIAEPAPLGDMVASDDTAEVLHALACACPRIDDRPYHQGYDFHELAGALEARVLEQHLAAQAGPAGRHAAPAVAPVEAKVKAGAYGSTAAGLVVVLLSLLLQQLDVIGDAFGGQYPWVATVVLLAGAFLPAVIGTWQAYDAPHSPRCGS